MILAIQPLSFIVSAVGSSEHALAVFSAVPPLSFVLAAIRPDEGTNALVTPSLPFPIVLGSSSCLVEAFAMVLALGPVAFILGSIREGQDSKAMRVPELPVALVPRPILIDDQSHPFGLSLLQGAFVARPIRKAHEPFFIQVVLPIYIHIILLVRRQLLFETDTLVGRWHWSLHGGIVLLGPVAIFALPDLQLSLQLLLIAGGVVLIPKLIVQRQSCF
mmetsp:Transcript_23481/g.23141  ORF Transcript_23481/g.23141 Transcript_23481/m.23141 type:complete len:218 (-) Transcript_23481:902-1555(-)